MYLGGAAIAAASLVVLVGPALAATPKTTAKTVVFKVTNVGKLPHDFKISGRKTALIAPGKTATLRVNFPVAGKYPYLCTVPGHAAAGMKGVFTIK